MVVNRNDKNEKLHFPHFVIESDYRNLFERKGIGDCPNLKERIQINGKPMETILYKQYKEVNVTHEKETE